MCANPRRPATTIAQPHRIPGFLTLCRSFAQSVSPERNEVAPPLGPYGPYAVILPASEYDPTSPRLSVLLGLDLHVKLTGAASWVCRSSPRTCPLERGPTFRHSIGLHAQHSARTISSACLLAWPNRPAFPRYPSPGESSPASWSASASILASAWLPRSQKKLLGSSIAAYRAGMVACHLAVVVHRPLPGLRRTMAVRPGRLGRRASGG